MLLVKAQFNTLTAKNGFILGLICPVVKDLARCIHPSAMQAANREFLKDLNGLDVCVATTSVESSAFGAKSQVIAAHFQENQYFPFDDLKIRPALTIIF